jgi:hypothetical protein
MGEGLMALTAYDYLVGLISAFMLTSSPIFIKNLIDDIVSLIKD